MGRPHLGRAKGTSWGVQDAGTRAAAAPSSGYPTPDLHQRGHPPQAAADKALASGATPGRRSRVKLARLGEQGAPAGGAARRGTDLDGAGVLAVVQQPHGAAVLALQAPAAAAHQPAQHLPARPPASGRDAAALRTPDQAPLSRAAPRRPLAPAPSPQRDRRRCLLPARLLLLFRHRLPPAESKRRTLSAPRPTARVLLVGRGLGQREANGGQRGGTEWQTEEPIETEHCDDRQVREAIAAKQSHRAKSDPPSGVPNQGLLFSLRFG